MSTSSPVETAAPRRSPVKKLYDWVLSLAERPSGTWALFAIAFVESSFFPIPPDVLLIALSVGAPRRALYFAGICTVGSVLGGAFGYLLGMQFYSLIGKPIIEFYGAGDTYEQVKVLYQQWDAIAVAIAGFTPVPYKVFTIAAGAFEINFTTFMIASILSRGARFYLLAGLIRLYGAGIQRFIDRYFNLLTILFLAALIGGFIFLKYVI